MMRRERIIINERQAKVLKEYVLLSENNVYVSIVKTIIKDLIDNYEPLVGHEFNGFDYSPNFKIRKKTDNLEITALDLFNYLNSKYDGVNPELIKQIIRDWYSDDLDEDILLSKNIPLKT